MKVKRKQRRAGRRSCFQQWAQPFSLREERGPKGLWVFSPSSSLESCFSDWVGEATRSSWGLDASLHPHTSASSPAVPAPLGSHGVMLEGQEQPLVPAAPQGCSAGLTGEPFAAQQVVALGHLTTNSLLLRPYHTIKIQLLPLIQQVLFYFFLW